MEDFQVFNDEEEDEEEDDYEVNSEDLESQVEKTNTENDEDCIDSQMEPKRSSDDLFQFEEQPDYSKNRNKGWELEDDKSYHDQLKKEKLSRTKNLFIQMEYCEGNSLKDAIDKKIITDEKTKWNIIIQILDALSYIHSKGLIHRDIKPPNIFLEKNFQVKLGDFGLATVSKSKNVVDNLNKLHKKEFILKSGNDLLSCGIGTKYYISPEQENNNKYDDRTDMYSLGILIFEMFYTFDSLMERDIILRGLRENRSFPIRFVNNAPKNIIEMVKTLIVKDPNNRPSAFEVLNSSLIPFNFNEKILYDNFSKIIEENNNYINQFIDILIEQTIKNIPSRLQPVPNLSAKVHGLEDKSGTLNYFSHKICYILTKLFNQQTPEFINVPDHQEMLNGLQLYSYIDGKVINIEDSFRYKPNLMLSREGQIVWTPTHPYGNLHEYFLNRKTYPVKFYTHSLSPIVRNHGQISDFENVMAYISLWREGVNRKILFNDDTQNQIDFLEVFFTSISTLDVTNNVSILINSSFIIDIIFSKLGLDPATKVRIISLLQKLKQYNPSSHSSPTNITKLILSQSSNFPIDREKLKELLSWLDIFGDIETVRKRFDKKQDIHNELEKIEQLIRSDYLWAEFINIRHRIKVDLSIVPKDFTYYSGLFFQVVYQDNNERIVIAEGGR